MRRVLRVFAGWSVVLLLASGLTVQGCQDEAGMTTAPDLASATATRSLKVSGGGSGTGTVTAPSVAGVPEMTCSITAATYDPIECTRSYPRRTTLTLTATPAPGSRLKEWRGVCTGTASTCTVDLSTNQSARAVFAGSSVASFHLNVTGGGTGNGTITSQPGLTPAIACTITNGTTLTGDCSRSYASGTSVLLSTVAAGGHSFDNWSGDCAGTGTCSLSITVNRSVTANLSAPLGPEATFGQWESSRSTPVIAVSLSLLPNGHALMWGHGGEPQVWNPAGGFLQATNATCSDAATCELFCSGHTFLADGRLLVAGGHNESLGDNNGLRQASTFDGSSWQPAPSMNYRRWYPTLVTLENGDVVALSGNQTPAQVATVPERFNGSSWSQLTGATLSLPLYPRAFVEPRNGHVFVAGEGTVRFLDPSGAGAWTTGPQRMVSGRSYGSAVMVDSKVLYAGGGGGSCPGTVERSAEIIDLAAASPSWSLTGQMNSPRRQYNLTVLPDGTVLGTGGSSECGFTTETGAVFSAEIWDPATGQWRAVGSAGVVRVYHSTTALLPDGRVLSSGSGDGGGVTQQFTYEIFSPPYLFKGSRPSYNLASTAMRYGQLFTVTTADAASIRKVTIVRLASSTHAFDMGQRLNTLSFQAAADGQSLTITAPGSGRIAPPGPYLLFILNDKGVPSVAQTVLLSP
jgi:hypothetical protein